MRKIAWTPKSLRAYKRLIRKNPQLQTALSATLTQLADDPFHPTLKTHKLSGEFDGIWSASIDYSYRILFEQVLDFGNKIKPAGTHRFGNPTTNTKIN